MPYRLSSRADQDPDEVWHLLRFTRKEGLCTRFSRWRERDD